MGQTLVVVAQIVVENLTVLALTVGSKASNALKCEAKALGRVMAGTAVTALRLGWISTPSQHECLVDLRLRTAIALAAEPSLTSGLPCCFYYY